MLFVVLRINFCMKFSAGDRWPDIYLYIAARGAVAKRSWRLNQKMAAELAMGSHFITLIRCSRINIDTSVSNARMRMPGRILEVTEACSIRVFRILDLSFH